MRAIAARMAHLGRSCRGGILFELWRSLCKEDARTLNNRGASWTCPKIAKPRPSEDGRRPIRLPIKANNLPTRGLIALMALILFGVAPAVYPPVGDLSRLFRIFRIFRLFRIFRIFRIFLKAPVEASGASRKLFDHPACRGTAEDLDFLNRKS